MAAVDAIGGRGDLSRALAARAVARVVWDGQTLESALAGADQAPTQRSSRRSSQGSNEGADLPDRDRAHVQALAFGAVRWHHRHRAIIAALLDRPLRRRDRILDALLSVGLFELLDTARPDYAAVSATVGATRLLARARAAGMVNAALRRFQREAASILPCALVTDEARYSHPGWLIDRLRSDWPDDWTRVLEANQQRPPLWIRVNSWRTSPADYAGRLRAELGLEATTLAACPDALRLERAVSVASLPGFADGFVTVQDAASQLAAGLLDPRPGMRVLDACAAPGGKATHLLEHCRGAIDLTVLDVAAERLRLVEANLRRLDQAARVVAGDALRPGDWWDGQLFDRILLDVPCSATGVIRRHPDIKFLRRASDLPALVERQRLLLDALWPLLRPGGRLLYATCSLFRAENAELIASWLSREPGARELPLPALGLAAGGPADRGPGRQLLPGTADTDGFYYALMERAPG